MSVKDAMKEPARDARSSAVDERAGNLRDALAENGNRSRCAPCAWSPAPA